LAQLSSIAESILERLDSEHIKFANPAGKP
jgi:hypothetical protein